MESSRAGRFDLRSGKASQFHPNLPTPATDKEKVIYVKRRLYVIVASSLISFPCITFSQVRFGIRSPVLWIFLLVTAILLFYFVISLLVNVGTKDFELEEHRQIISQTTHFPSVDVLLPVCNEPIRVIENAWKYISRLEWPGTVTFYCLDDGNNQAVKELAKKFGFKYLVRPNRPHLQKAGNLLHGFQNSCGEFILIFDADFCPRSDMLKEMMPYLINQHDLAIIQSPQYFRVTKQQGWLERGAGSVQELFYRIVQQSRQQQGAAICVGTNAIYRRAALEQNGGPTQIGHSEDVHTGFDLRRLGWDLKYIPLVYAIGICPALRDSFLAQQYRWCMGSMSLLGSKKFWVTRMSLRARCGYLSGFSYYLTTAMVCVVGPLIPLVLLLFYPGLIKLHNYIFIVPSMVYTLVIFPLWHRHPYRLSALATKMIYSWAHLFAVRDFVMRSHKPWDPTGSSDNDPQLRTTKFVLTRQFNLCIVLWGGGTAVVWLGLAIYRLQQGGWLNFVPILFTGILYGLIVLKCLTSSLPRSDSRYLDPRADDDVVHLPHHH